MQFRILAVIFAFVLLSSCGAKNYSTAPTIEIPKISKSKLIKKTMSKSFQNSEITTAKINSKLSYEVGDASQKLGLKIRIAKGERIWLSADFFNIPVAKLLIEGSNVQYYNKIDKTYFKGSLDFVKQLMGTEVTYQMLENLFTGDLIMDLDQGTYKLSRENNLYSFRNIDLGSANKKLEIYPLTHKIKSQSTVDYGDKKSFATYYSKYQNVDGFLFPRDVSVKAKNKEKNTTISMNYSSVTFDEELKFPFKIPKDCTNEIVLDSGKVKKRKKK